MGFVAQEAIVEKSPLGHFFALLCQNGSNYPADRINCFVEGTYPQRFLNSNAATRESRNARLQ
jgi:hypothetical protein